MFKLNKKKSWRFIIYVHSDTTCHIYIQYLSHLFNQVVNMEFEGGVTAAFSMVAFTEEICQRKTTISGSKVGKKC